MGKTKEDAMGLRQLDNELGQQKAEPISKGLMPEGNNLLKMDMGTIETIARAIVQEVQDGNKDAMDVLIYAKKGATFFKAIDDNVKEFAYAKQYATKGNPYAAHGCKVESSELGVKYDYASSGSTEWQLLKAKADAAKKALEDHEKFLKSIHGSISMNDKDTGEVMEVREPIKSGTMGYKISIG